MYSAVLDRWSVSLTGVCIPAKNFNHETLHRSRGAGVRLGMISNPGDKWPGLMSKAVHCTAVNNELPVGASAVHFFHKRAHVRHRDMRIQCTMADEYLRLNQPRLSWP